MASAWRRESSLKPFVKKCEQRGLKAPYAHMLVSRGASLSFAFLIMTAIAPTIHLNGTSGKDLWKEYHTAYTAIDAAIDALYSATCNGRDFYVQGPAAFSQARSERDAALAKLREVKSYTEEILMGIMAQQ